MATTPFDLDSYLGGEAQPKSKSFDLDSFLESTKTDKVNDEAQLPQPTHGFDLDSFLSGKEQTPPTPAAQPSSGSSFIDKTKEIWNSDENPIAKVWDTANTPLVDLKRQGATGVEAGVEDFASGFTSPLNVALTAVTLGAGPLLERMGIQVGEMAAPQLVKAAKTAGKLAAAGFTAIQLKGIAQESPEFTQAIENGDTDKALEIGTSMALQGGAAFIGAKHTAKEFGMFGGLEENKTATPKDLLVGKYQARLVRDNQEANEFVKDFKKSVPDQSKRDAIHFYAESGGDAAKLAEWQGKVEENKSIAPDLQRQVVTALKKAQDLNSEDIAQADKLRRFYDANLYRATLPDEEDGSDEASYRVMKPGQQRDNYVARGKWENEPEEEDAADSAKTALGEGGNDHTKMRVFQTTVDGILQGKKPVKAQGRYALDAADLAGDYHRSIGRVIAKKAFVEDAKRMRASDMRPLAAPGGAISKFDETIHGEDTGGTVTVLDSNGKASHALTKGELSTLIRTGKLDEMVKSGKIVDRGPRPAEEEEEETPETPASTAPKPEEAATQSVQPEQPAAAAAAEEPAKEEPPSEPAPAAPVDVEAIRKAMSPTEKKALYLEAEKNLAARGITFENASADGSWGDHIVAEQNRVLEDRNTQKAGPLTAKGDDADENYLSAVGELRTDRATGKPALWLGSEGMQALTDASVDLYGEKAANPIGNQYNGVSLSRDSIAGYIDVLQKRMEDFQGTPAEKSDFIANTIELQHLLRTAEAQAGKEGVTVIGNLGRGLGKTIDTAREEYNHAWQRTLSDTGDADQHLPKPQMKELYRALPMKAHAYLDASNYPNTYADRVVETAAKLMAGKDMGIPHEEAAAFLSKYFDAVAKEHGDESLQSLQHVVGVAKQLRDERIGNGTAEAGVPNERPDEGVLGSTQEGRPEGDRGSPSQEVLADKGAGRDSDGVKKTDENYYGRYRYSLSDYDNTIQHRFAHTSVYSGTDGTFLRARLAFHPEIAKQARSILAPEKSFIQTNPVLSKILGISTQAKHSLLSLSGFHWAQIGLRGVESGVNPIKPFVEMLKGNGGWDMNNPEHLALVESGGTHPGIPGASESFTEGVKGGAGPISKIPGVGHVLDSVNNALFGANGFIDRMKLETALSFAKRLESIKPELTKTERFKIAGQMANYRYGGLDYLQMGRSQTAQDILRLTLLAPDWMESNFRDAASMLGPYGRLSRFDFARIALYNFAAAQTINMLSTGKMHLEQPFGVVSKDGKKVYSVRTMPQDIYHALTQPMDYATNRLNPLIARTGVEALFGRDKQGHLRDVGEQIKDLLANVSPIPLQGVTNALTGNFHPGETGGDYVRSALGLTSKPNNSSAEQLAYKLASQNSSSGRMSSDELAHFHKVMTYEDRLRDGDVSALADLHREVLQGKIPMSSYRQVLKGSQQSRLSSTINRLPMSDAIDVWNLSTNDERGVIGPVMMKKIMDFRKTEQQRLTPAERARMDVKLAAVVDGMFTAAGQK